MIIQFLQKSAHSVELSEIVTNEATGADEITDKMAEADEMQYSANPSGVSKDEKDVQLIIEKVC